MRESFLVTTIEKHTQLPFHCPFSWFTIISDASSIGWGAYCLSEIAQGRWQFPSHKIVLNILELWAAFCVLQDFHHLTKGALVPLGKTTLQRSPTNRDKGDSQPYPITGS